MTPSHPALSAALGVILAALGLGAPEICTAAAAVPNNNTVFDFFGDCLDCYGGNGSVGGALTLRDFQAGETLTLGNFVSFAYGGSDLMDPFTVEAVTYIDGALNTDGSLASRDFKFDFDVGGCDNCGFTLDSGHFWFIGRPSDFGRNGTLTRVPAPVTLALLPLGLAALAMTYRRKAA